MRAVQLTRQTHTVSQTKLEPAPTSYHVNKLKHCLPPKITRRTIGSVPTPGAHSPSYEGSEGVRTGDTHTHTGWDVEPPPHKVGARSDLSPRLLPPRQEDS